MASHRPAPLEDLILPVPELLSATYLVPTALDGGAAKSRVDAAVQARVPDPMGTAARKLLEVGAARLVSLAEVPPLSADFQRHLGIPADLMERVSAVERFLAVSVTWKPGWPPVHESVARACAAALADDLGSPLVDAFVPQVLSAEKALATLPDARYQLRLKDWVLVFQSAGHHGLWITTKGMGRFGLPEVQAENVPPQYGNLSASLVTGIADRLLNLWLGALRARGDAAFAQIPGTFEVSETNVADAYGTEPEPDGGSVSVRVTFDPASADGRDSFLTIQPPDDYPGSAGEYFTHACEEVFGRTEREIRYVPATDAMEQAVRKARETLPSARSRFLEGNIPLHARLMVKYKLDSPEGAEFPWAYVNSWKDAGTVLGNSASDAIHDPRVRVGRPVVIGADAITDWGIWVDGQGIVEGGFTNSVAFGVGEPGIQR
jgi:hypothetical protein